LYFTVAKFENNLGFTLIQTNEMDDENELNRVGEDQEERTLEPGQEQMMRNDSALDDQKASCDSAPKEHLSPTLLMDTGSDMSPAKQDDQDKDLAYEEKRALRRE
jgi:hypothetical protein